MKTKKGGGLSKIFKDSFFVSRLDQVSKKIYLSASHSMAGKFFQSFGGGLTDVGESFFVSIFKKLKILGKFSAFIKRKTAEKVDTSFILHFLRLFTHFFINIRTRIYGTFGVSAGIMSALVWSFKRYYLMSDDASYTALAFSLVTVIASVPLIFSSEYFADSLSGSRIMNFILFDLLGVRKVSLIKNKKYHGLTNSAIMIGVLTGAATYFIPLYYIATWLLLIIAAYTVLCIPESGIIIMLLVFPFLSPKKLVILTLYVFVCFVFKVIRGKRTVKFDMLGIAVLLFGLTLCVNSIMFSEQDGIKPLVFNITSVLCFFLVTNLIKSKQFLQRCIVSSLISLFCFSSVGIIGYLLGMTDRFINTEQSFLAGLISPSVLNVPELAASAAVCLIIPVFFVLSDKKYARYNARAFGVFVIGLVFVFITHSTSAWFGIVAGIILFFAAKSSKNPVRLLLILVAVLPFITFFPTVFSERLRTLNSLSNTFISDKIRLWNASAAVFKENFVTGIGNDAQKLSELLLRQSDGKIADPTSAGSLYLQTGVQYGALCLALMFVILLLLTVKTVTSYKNGNDGQIRLMTSALYAGFSALCFQGIFCYIWQDVRIMFLFWIMSGLVSSCASLGRVHDDDDMYI